MDYKDTITFPWVLYLLKNVLVPETVLLKKTRGEKKKNL